MCRSIKPLFNYSPKTTKEEIKEASIQFVRKVSGFRSPSKVNELQFETAVNDISLATEKLMKTLITKSKPRNRSIEIEKRKLKRELDSRKSNY